MQSRSSMVRTAQVRPFKVAAVEIRPNEYCRAEVQALEAQSGQVLMGKIGATSVE